MTEDNRIPEIRELVARHRANVSKHATPDELDVLLGIDPNDPVQRYANLLVRLTSILDSAPPADGSCPDGECNQGMCGGISDPAGPCGGCCGCLSGCLDAGPPLRASEERAIPEPTEGQNRGE